MPRKAEAKWKSQTHMQQYWQSPPLMQRYSFLTVPNASRLIITPRHGFAILILNYSDKEMQSVMNGLVKYRILLHPSSLTESLSAVADNLNSSRFLSSNFSFCHYEPKGGEWFPWEWPHLTPCHVTCQNKRNVFTSSSRYFIHPTATAFDLFWYAS